MPGFEYDYDDSQLQQLFEQLDEKQQVQALKGGFRKAANNFRKAAVSNLRSTEGGKRKKPLRSIVSQSDLESGIRALVFKRKLGFRVTVGENSRNKKGYHMTRNKNSDGENLLKPILRWAEDGTARRWTKSNGGKHTRMFSWRKRRSHTTGKFGPYKFMGKTKEQESAGISNDLQKQIRKNVMAVAKRNGCRI